MCLAVTVGALSPQTATPQVFALADKVVHAGAFFCLALVGLRAYPARGLAIVLALIVFGGAIELAQGFTSSRSQELGDFVADSIGIAVGTALHTVLTAASGQAARLPRPR